MTKEEFNRLTDKYLAGKASPEEEKLIEEFFNTYDKISDPQRENIRSKEMYETFRQWKEVEMFARRPHTNFFRRPIGYISIVTLIACAFFITYRSDLWKTKISEITKISNNGEQLTITLPDGSVVSMNSGSSIIYPETFSADQRLVKLTGEAFFDVAHDADKPFIVQTEKLATRVLGTRFNVRAFPDEQISVTVEKGKVEVSTTAGTGKHHAILTPGLQGAFDPDQNRIITAKVDLEVFLAWKNGTLIFDNSSLEATAKVLERWYDVSINFKNDNIKSCHINGQYKNQTIDDVLESIRYMYKIEYKHTDSKKFLLDGQGCN